ncbi:MAG: PHP domain-containing protein [Acidobacteriota bacterium]
MIDLHTHTTASDGRCTPPELVARASAAGVVVLSVTDHDTVAGCVPVAAACRAASIEFVTGIEVTAVLDGIDVHVLGYFIDPASPEFADFLSKQRRVRIDRLRQIVALLAGHGIVLDADAILKRAIDDPSVAAGRPWIARALVDAGHVPTTNEAFRVWLTPGRPAFVPRAGATPDEVIDRIHSAHGIAAVAHPGLRIRDEWLPQWVERSGLDAIEAYHPDHDAPTTRRYVALAARLGVAVSGGSDFHGDQSHGASIGSVSLPRQAYQRLVELKGNQPDLPL